MKHIRKFSTQAEYDAFKATSPGYVVVSLVEGQSGPQYLPELPVSVTVNWGTVPTGASPVLTDNLGNTCTYPATSYVSSKTPIATPSSATVVAGIEGVTATAVWDATACKFTVSYAVQEIYVSWGTVPTGKSPVLTDNNGKTCTYPATSYIYTSEPTSATVVCDGYVVPAPTYDSATKTFSIAGYFKEYEPLCLENSDAQPVYIAHPNWFNPAANVQYSEDKVTWSDMPTSQTTSISFPSGKFYLRVPVATGGGKLLSTRPTQGYPLFWDVTHLSGEIDSLKGLGFGTEGAFDSLFAYINDEPYGHLDLKDLKLSEDLTGSKNTYKNMFKGSVINGLPTAGWNTKILTDSCCESMFEGAIGIFYSTLKAKMEVLFPADLVLAPYCFKNAFKAYGAYETGSFLGWSSDIVFADTKTDYLLQPTTLAEGCYEGMFSRHNDGDSATATHSGIVLIADSIPAAAYRDMFYHEWYDSGGDQDTLTIQNLWCYATSEADSTSRKDMVYMWDDKKKSTGAVHQKNYGSSPTLTWGDSQGIDFAGGPWTIDGVV